MNKSQVNRALVGALICLLSLSSAGLGAQTDFDRTDDKSPYIQGFVVYSVNTTVGLYTYVDVRIVDPDGSLPGSIASLTVSGPETFSHVFDVSTEYTGDGYFFFQGSGAPPVGTYTAQVVDADGRSATATDYFGGGTPLPVADTAGMQASGDALTPVLSWSGLNYGESSLFYRARIFEVAGPDSIIRWTSPRSPQTVADVPPGVIEAGKSYQWRVEVFDNDVYYAIDRRSNSDMIDLVLDNQTPYVTGATVFMRRLADGTVDTAFEADINDPDGELPGAIQSITVTPPGGSPIDMTGGWLADFSEYWLTIPGAAQDGIYQFTVTDNNGNTKTTYDYAKPHSLGRVDAASLMAVGTWPTPTLSWSAPADISGPTYYRVIIEDVASGARVYSSSRTTQTYLSVPTGYLQTNGTYRWYVRAYDDPRWIVYNNETRSDVVGLSSATVSDRAYASYASAYQRSDPDRRSTYLEIGFSDPDGLPVVSVAGLGGYAYTFTPEDFDPAFSEYFYRAPANLPEGVYSFTLTPAGGGNPIVTHAYLKTVTDIPAIDPASVKISGDPMMPTVSWTGVDGYDGQLYYRVVFTDEDGNWLQSTNRNPLTALSASSPIRQAVYRFRIEAYDHPDYVTYKARTNTPWFTVRPWWNVAGPLPDTGQTKCYDNSGEITCPSHGSAFYGQDGNFLINPPSYTKLDANGYPLPEDATSWAMVRDNLTGLIWEVKTDDGSIHDKDNTYTWYDSNPETNGGDAGTPGDGADTEDFIADLNAANFGGFSDWRLPTKSEIRSIVDYSSINKSINAEYFPNAKDAYYWSSTTRANEIDFAWSLYFKYGYGYSLNKSSNSCVRAVRGGQHLHLSHLFINNDGTVTDANTGLMWQQNTPSDTMTWAQSLSYTEGLDLAGHTDWRLPSIKEIDSIVDFTRTTPSIDPLYFPDTQSTHYWSSTVYLQYVNNTSGLSFNNGNDSSLNWTDLVSVRAVRGGQLQLTGHIIVLSPAQGDRWYLGTSRQITWDPQGISGDVSISISRDGGKTFTDIAASTPNDGSYLWEVVGPESVNCAIRITPLSDPTKASVQSLFTIEPDPDDTDRDGLPDAWETTYFGDLSHDGTADSDTDGLTDSREFEIGTTPNSDDTDGDGMPDGWEVANGLTPQAPDALLDDDNDQFVNGREFQDGTDPQDEQSHLILPTATGRVPDTGQTKCYDNSGEIACPSLGGAFYGQDGHYQINLPSYIKMDGYGKYLPDTAPSWAMVYDMVTGLIWEVKTDDGSIHDKDNTYTWYDSDSTTNGGDAGTAGSGTDTEDFISDLNAAQFGGHSDWRMPTVRELALLGDFSKNNPAIDSSVFPNTAASFYWSSSTAAGAGSDAWQMSFLTGHTYPFVKSTSAHMRAVHGKKTSPSGNWIANGAGFVTDLATGLMWEQKAGDGGVHDKDGTYTWEAALSWVADLNTQGYLGYRDWRLPTIKELSSLADYSQYAPAIDMDSFPNTASAKYWSATTPVGGGGVSLAWYMNFETGHTFPEDKTSSLRVHAVRGGQHFDSNSLYITSPLQASIWHIGDTMPISWETRDVGGDVSIHISYDGGITFETISAATENDGEFLWVIDGDASANWMLKIAQITEPGLEAALGLFSIEYPKAVLSDLPDDPTSHTTTAISVGGANVVAYQYRLDGGSWSTETSVNLAIQLAVVTGVHALDVIAKDDSGVWQPKSDATSFTWTVDASAPVISSFVISDTSTGSTTLTNDETVTIVFSATDNMSLSKYLLTETAVVPTVSQMNAGSGTAPTGYTIQSAGDGIKTLYAWAMDTLGNISVGKTATIVLDTVSSVSIDGEDRCLSTTSLAISGTREADATVALESVPSVTIGVVGYPTSTTWGTTVSGLTMGSTTITAIATDAAGNWDSDSVTVRQSTPATISFDAGGQTGLIADGVTTLPISAFVKDSGDNPVCDGTIVNVATTLGSIEPAVYTTDTGVFGFELIASTALGTGTVTGTVDGPLGGNIEIGMLPGEATHLVFTNQNNQPYVSPLLLPVNTQSPYIKVQIEDDYGHFVPAEANTSLVLSSSLGNDGLFSANAINWAAQLPVVINEGSAFTYFWFKYTSPQVVDITITADDFDARLLSANMVVQEQDSTPPVTTASPPGGSFSAGRDITLTCDDGYGSGCQGTYYSTDGSNPTTPYTSAIPLNGTTMLKFYSVDHAGNPEAVKTQNYTIDAVSPTIVITKPENAPAVPGPLHSITGTATDTGSGISTVKVQISYEDNGTYYLDAAKNWIQTPIEVPALYESASGTRSLGTTNVFDRGEEYTVTVTATDAAGNVAVDFRTFLFDIIPTDISLQVDPIDGQLGASTTISGVVTNALTDPAAAVTDAAGATVTIEVTPPTGSGLTPDAINKTLSPQGAYQLEFGCGSGLVKAGVWSAKALWTDPNDKYLGAESSPVAFTLTPANTRLSLDINQGQSLKTGTAPQISGRLALLKDCAGAELSGLDVHLTFTPPTGQGAPQVVTVKTGSGGEFLVSSFTFPQEGAWSVAAAFDGTGDFLASDSGAVSVNVLANAGYALIVQGKTESGEGLLSHGFTASNVYKVLKKRELSDEDIVYLNYETDLSSVVVDGVPSWSAVRTAITTTIKNKIIQAPGDLTIVMIDHGDRNLTDNRIGEFYVYSASPSEPDVITSTDLASWLQTLQEDLAAAGVSERRIVVVLGFCHAGEFMDELKGDNRIVITSAARNEKSHRGQQDTDDEGRNVRDGEVFVSEFFKGVEVGKSVRDAFVGATRQISEFTELGTQQNGGYPFFDKSAQHPLLDDSGDGVGTHEINAGSSDGQVSAQQFIGTSPDATNAGEGVSITRVANDVFLPSGKNFVEDIGGEKLIWSEIAQVDHAWLELKRPGYSPVDPGRQQQLSIDTVRKYADGYNTALKRYEWSNLGQANQAFPEGFFNDPGTYQVFYYAKHLGETSPMKAARIYKNFFGNQPPRWDPPDGELIAPANGEEVVTRLLLDWRDAEDPDGHGMTYTVMLSRDNSTFAEPILIEGVKNSVTTIGPEQGIQDGYTYFWKVRVVDEYGGFDAANDTEIRWFTTNNTNAGFPCFLKGIVFDQRTGAFVKGAQVDISGGGSLLTAANGLYLASFATGNYEISVSADGYQTIGPLSVDLSVAGGIVTRNVGLQPVSSGVPGDADGDTHVTISDAILVLKGLVGQGMPFPDCDVDGDNRVDMKEMIYILQTVSAVR